MNLITRLTAAAAVTALVWSSCVLAHPPGADGQHDDHHHMDPAKIRMWTNAKTGEVVRGAFLAAREVDGAVRISIERESGDVVVFLLADLAAADRVEAQRRIDEVKAANERLAEQAIAEQSRRAQAANKPDAPAQSTPFNAFAPFVSTRWDDRWLYVESDGLPHMPGGKTGTYVFSHPMMVGITAWQQQVPLPQNYRGANAWQIPLKPQLAEKPVSAKEQLFRGAIALAANGVPIFNPIKNDGKTDTFLAGELDEFGGHCGRADDYHYHIAPTHLQKYVGAGQPVAYALDGFPIYGIFDPAAKVGGPGDDKCCPLGSHEPLDLMNGHFAPAPAGSTPGGKGLYHYHASVKYPYLNGGMRGVVAVKDDQIDPQPRASSPRAALPPLRGAKITGFKATNRGEQSAGPAWSLEYLLGGKKNSVNYRLENGKWIFDFVDPTGATKTDTYDATNPQRRPGGGGGRGEEGGGGGRKPREDGAGRGGGGGEGPRRDQTPRPDAPPPQPENNAPKGTPEPTPKTVTTGFALSSPDVTEGRLSVDCTCDGKSRMPALKWDKRPEGTKAFAVVMHHVARDGDTHVYMVVANLPTAASELKSDDKPGVKGGEAIWGQNTVNRKNAYAPPCSQGPGDKTYTITLYALSAEAKLSADKPLTRDSLLAAIKDSTLSTATLDVKYARTAK